MDLELLEALALSEDRTTALAQLLPGSEDHDYYRCLHAQHAGALDDAERIIEQWQERHGSGGQRYERLRFRQQLCRLSQDPDSVADELRDRFSVSHWHEAEVAEVDAKRPTKLEYFDGIRLLETAAEHAADLKQVTDEGLYELLERPLDPTRRRALLQRIGHTPQAALVAHLAEDLAVKGSAGFGSLRIHNELTLPQLLELAAKRPELRTHSKWIDSVIRRMRPPFAVDLDLDREARESYLLELWQFVGALPPASNSLKAHVLWHLLDTICRRNAVPDRALVVAYLELPRQAAYLPRKWLERVRESDIAKLGADFREVTGLAPAGDDERLVRYLLRQRLDQAEQFAQWLDRAWLDLELASSHLLAGTGDADRATLVLGAARAAELRERVEIYWCVHNPSRFGVDEPIVLEADIKHVPELVVKVFRIDPLAYFQLHRREIGVEVDLDGLAASHELVMSFSEPPVRRVRRRIELPMCARAGTYVIDLIGNGRSSRAVVHKGRLRHVARLGAAGHVVTILDEHGKPRADARAWLGEREYTPDEQGMFVVPFSTTGGAQPMLLAAGDVASVASLQLEREIYALDVALALDRQAITAGRAAQAVARVRLTVAGAPASLQIIEQATWHVTLFDRAGVATTKSQPLALADDNACTLEWPIGEDTARVHLAIRGRVRVVSTQSDQSLQWDSGFDVAAMYGTTSTEALYLALGAAGWVVTALGKTGEPRARRPVTIALVHRYAHTQWTYELATDEAGRIELGPLPGATRIAATLGGYTESWQIEDPARSSGLLQLPAGRDAIVHLPASRSAQDAMHRLSLVETRAGSPVRHVQAEITPLAGALSIRGLTPGEYVLRAPGAVQLAIRVANAGAEISGHVVSGNEVVDITRVPPAIAELGVAGDMLRVQLAGASARTRVHAIATRFVPSPVSAFGSGAARPLAYRIDRAQAAIYVSGRELGDEYRYVLERRAAKRYPGLLLDKPSLLLNPWARRTSSSGVAHARAGGAYAPQPSRSVSNAYGRAAAAPEPVMADGGTVGFDFLGETPAVLANLVPDATGAVTIPLAALGHATTVVVIVDDPHGVAVGRVALAEVPIEPRDLRLKLALDPARAATQKKAIAPLRTGDTLVIEDLATAKVHLVDSIERAHAYLCSLRDDATLREFSFVARWHAMPDSEKRELYSKYACHELHLFLYFKDRAFFDAVVRPYLAHKRTKTFVDHWLLDADLAPYLELDTLARLNAAERALLARRMQAAPAIARFLEDEVAVHPPAPAIDTRLIDALIGASTLDADDALGSLGEAARGRAEAQAETTGEHSYEAAAPPMARPAGMMPPQAGARSSPPRPAPAPMQMKAGVAGFARADDEMEVGPSETLGESPMHFDLERRREAPAAHYRAGDKTQEWAENNWYKRTPAESAPDMIGANRLWRDVARGVTLSPWLGLATGSFAEAMCALAVIDLPFVAGKHALDAQGARLAITAAGNALAGSSQLVLGELQPGGAPLVVGQSYVRADDRYRWVDGEQVDKYVDGALAAGVVYTCQIVLANPSSSRQRVAALVQIPRGSLALAGARQTVTIDIVLEPYGTHGHEYSFYFPQPGTYSHFPVHVTRGESIIAAAPARALAVTDGAEVADTTSWAYVSQRGSLADVVAFLDRENLCAIEPERAAWRLKDRAAYDAIVGALENRRVYCEALWGYALLHRDATRLRAWARALGPRLLEAGPVLDMASVELDAEALGGYEHLELSPLVNARAHALGGKLRILDSGLDAQYRRFLDLVAHRRAPTSEDLLAAAAYLLAQDRIDAAVAALGRVTVDRVAEKLQHDYLAAYAACVLGQLPRARELVSRWRDLPVDRWRRKHEALAAMLDELEGAPPAITDPKSREQQHAELAAKQPTFELAVDRDGVFIHHQHVTALELRFFEMDVELLFSRQPFVQSDVSRFSYIEPGHREQVANPPVEHRVAWPAALRGKNVVVEAVGAGQRKAKIHYANDLATSLANNAGQVRVQRASDRAVLPATYVKVYAKNRGGGVTFYKDGYTDLRGWFDYATLSTDDLDRVERFAILVCSDQSGAAILETSPPVR
jgi:hypothetical protein